MSNDVQAYAAAITSWVAAMLALMGAYQDQIMFWLGLALVLARLTQEIPKAIQQFKKVFKRDG